MAKVISVIVPTMWKANSIFFKMLPLLEWSYAVGEVIIIDNNTAETPHEELKKYNKILRLPMEKNLYCNPSFNLGVKVASNELICLLNDDAVFDPRIFEYISTNMNKECGLITPHAKYFNRGSENAELMTKLELLPVERFPDGMVKNHDGFAVCMFLNREHYETIPDELVHHFGDTFISLMQDKRGRQNYTLHNWTVMTPMRMTTSVVPEIGEIINKDWEKAPAVFERHGLPNPIRY